MNPNPPSHHDPSLKAALRALPSPQPSHGFDARLVERLSSLPRSASQAEALGQLALAGSVLSRVPARGRFGSRAALLAAGLLLAGVLGLSAAAWMQSASSMPSNLLEPDTLSVLSYGLL